MIHFENVGHHIDFAFVFYLITEMKSSSNKLAIWCDDKGSGKKEVSSGSSVSYEHSRI